jgi:cephalosporin hydroxylase
MHLYRKDDGLPPGWFDPIEVEAYQELINRVSGGVVVEVGVANGRSFCCIAELCKQQRLSQIAVDMEIPRVFLDEIRKRKINALTVQADSLRAARCFNPHSLAGVFIDSDHSYDAVKMDLVAWWPLVRQGGFLAGHDFGCYTKELDRYDHEPHPEQPGVMEAVREIMGEPAKITGTVWEFWKD